MINGNDCKQWNSGKSFGYLLLFSVIVVGYKVFMNTRKLLLLSSNNGEEGDKKEAMMIVAKIASLVPVLIVARYFHWVSMQFVKHN